MPDDVSQHLQHLVERTGLSKTFYIVQAISEHIDNLEDFNIAEQRLIAHRAGRSHSFMLDEVERELGLAD